MTYRYKYNRTLVPFSQSNKHNQTDAENKLWYYLRNRRLHGYKFRRQYAILNYVLDFYCVEQKLAIELDGSQHVENEEYDTQRTEQLQKLGIQLLRFWDTDALKHTKQVLEQILMALNAQAGPDKSLLVSLYERER